MERKRTANVGLYFKVINRDLVCNLYDVTLLCRWVRSGKGGYFKGIVKNYSNIVLCISYERNVEYHMQSEKRAQFSFDINGIFGAGTRRCQPLHYNLQEMSTTTLQPAGDVNHYTTTCRRCQPLHYNLQEMSTTTLQPAGDPMLLCLFSGAFSK